MNDVEEVLLREGLSLVGDAITKLMGIDHEKTADMTDALHTVIKIGQNIKGE